MANQALDMADAIRIRPAKEKDAAHLHLYCFPEQTEEAVTEKLQADLAAESLTRRFVAESSNCSIGQITVTQNAIDPEIAHVGNLVVSPPFRQLGIADQLIKEAESAAVEDGAKTLEIELSSSEANTTVLDRYKGWGFVEKPIVILQKTLEEQEEQEEAETETEAETESPAAETGGEQQELLNA